MDWAGGLTGRACGDIYFQNKLRISQRVLSVSCLEVLWSAPPLAHTRWTKNTLPHPQKVGEDVFFEFIEAVRDHRGFRLKAQLCRGHLRMLAVHKGPLGAVPFDVEQLGQGVCDVVTEGHLVHRLLRCPNAEHFPLPSGFFQLGAF